MSVVLGAAGAGDAGDDDARAGTAMMRRILILTSISCGVRL
jgi:hypothetical protein